MTYLTLEQQMAYQRDGFVMVENAFNPDEISAMIADIEGGSGRVSDNLRKRADTSGRTANLSLWYDLGEDIWSYASTKPAIANGARILLGEEAAFFHGKVMLKEAQSGGKWEWHQDYGYWYNDGFVYPRMLSAYVALDRATQENGCLKVLRGSHLMGRVNHGTVAGQTGIDPERVSFYESLFETVYCEMAPGSVLFFHCNLLHASNANLSDYHRRAFIVCFNALGNPFITSFGKQGPNEFPCPVRADDAMQDFIAQQA